MDPALDAKSRNLAEILREPCRVVVAYSGGVDSSLLAFVAHEVLGDGSIAVTASSPSLARRELASAEALARRFGWNHIVVRTSELDREGYARNAPDRCYWCKMELFEVLRPIAERRGAHIIVGTNADDLDDFRPGLRAARENGVRSPLVEAGLTKVDVRALSRAIGLPTADRPASPCLPSRIAYGLRVTDDRLRRIEEAEDVLRSFGFETLRVRDHGDIARVEVPVGELAQVVAAAHEITNALKARGWRYVTLDLAGFRSGSLNEPLAPPHLRRGG